MGVVLLALVACGLGSAGMTAGPVAAVERASTVPPSPIGSFDAVSARFDDVWVVSGWAADADALDQPILVRIYEGARFVTQVSTGDPRPDVPAHMHGVGQNTGWHARIKPQMLSDQPGPLLCRVHAINIGAGKNTTLGCRHVRVASTSDPFIPVGFLDRVTASPGLLHVRGWAADPEGTPTTRLRILYNGLFVTSAVANRPRPDVAAALGFGGMSGFSLTLPVLPSDLGVQVCVTAENTGSAGYVNPTIGCTTRPTPDAPAPGAHDPRGVLDAADVDGGTGWAFDPDTPGPITVRLRSLTMPGVAPVRFAQGPTGVARPDVQSVFPAAGPNAGFAITFPSGPLSASASSARITCAYAVNSGPGANRLLGCRVNGP